MAAALKTRPKKAGRDPQVPIASWSTPAGAGTVPYTYELRYTGPNEFIVAPHNPKHSWGGKTPSLIVTERSVYGVKDHEVDPYHASTWGWIVRLITDGTIDRKGWEALTKTDEQLNRDDAVVGENLRKLG